MNTKPSLVFLLIISLLSCFYSSESFSFPTITTTTHKIQSASLQKRYEYHLASKSLPSLISKNNFGIRTKSSSSLSSIGGGSPILKYTTEQVNDLQGKLLEKYFMKNVKTYSGIIYRHLFTDPLGAFSQL